MHLISQNCTKWKALEFHANSVGVIHELSELNPIGGFPSLRKLVIQSNPRLENFDSSEDLIVDGFLDAPLLRELYFEGFPDFLKQLSVPWSQLTHYTCTSGTMGVPDALRVLSLTPKLIHARLSTSWSSTPGTTIPPLIRLKSLSFRSRDHRLSLGILRYVALPALQILDVGAIVPADMDALLSFLARSPCKLTTLSANTCLAPFIPCLRAIPTLSSLRLTLMSRISDDEDLSTFFQRLGDDTSFLPNLESLTVVNDGCVVFPYDALLEAFRARSISESSVQLRRITLCWTKQPFFYPNLRIEKQLVAIGVPIQFVRAELAET